jgi:hypothetical protein
MKKIIQGLSDKHNCGPHNINWPRISRQKTHNYIRVSGFLKKRIISQNIGRGKFLKKDDTRGRLEKI